MSRVKALQELGLTDSASEAEVKSAHRKLVRQYHPDTNPNGEVRMKLINAAYTRLTVDAKKPDPPDVQTPPPEEDPFANWGDWGRADASYQNNNSKIGISLYLNIDVPWEVANLGRNHVISYKVNGKAKRITVKIPKGSASGKQIRCAGKGEAGVNGGIAGDLYLTLNVLQNVFIDDIHTSLLLWSSETRAPCERVIQVTVDRYVKNIWVRVPANVKSGQTIKIVGVGNKSSTSSVRGNILVKIMVKTSQPGKDIEAYANVDSYLRIKMVLFKGVNVTLRDVNTTHTINRVLRLEAHHLDGSRYYLDGLGEKGDPGERDGKLWVTPRYTPGAQQFKKRSLGLFAILMISFIVISQNSDSADFAISDAQIEESYETPSAEPESQIIMWPPNGFESTFADDSFAYSFYEPESYRCIDGTSGGCIRFQVASGQDCTELNVKIRFYDSGTGEEEWVEGLFYDFKSGIPQDIELNTYTRFFDKASDPEVFCLNY